MLEIFKCGNCGKIVTISHEGAGQLVCCGRPMVKQAENSVDASNEKHVPVVEKQGDGILVKALISPPPYGTSPLYRVDRGHGRPLPVRRKA